MIDQSPDKLWNEPALSPRARSALHNLQIDTIEKLKATSDSIILRQPNCGLRTLAEIRAFMNTRLFGYDNANDMTYEIAFETIKKQRLALIQQEKIIMALQSQLAEFQSRVRSVFGD